MAEELKPNVRAVFDVLRDRKGFGWWWDGIDADIQDEIIAELNATPADTGEVAALRAALGLIDQMRDKTLIGDTVSLDPAIAYQHGANAAFAQAADIARAALGREG